MERSSIKYKTKPFPKSQFQWMKIQEGTAGWAQAGVLAWHSEARDCHFKAACLWQSPPPAVTSPLRREAGKSINAITYPPWALISSPRKPDLPSSWSESNGGMWVEVTAQKWGCWSRGGAQDGVTNSHTPRLSQTSAVGVKSNTAVVTLSVVDWFHLKCHSLAVAWSCPGACSKEGSETVSSLSHFRVQID